MSIHRFEQACLSGVRVAFTRHYAFTGGLALGSAPEGFIQGEIANALAKITRYVTLETSVYDTLADAGAERRGKLPRNARGRIDIVTWWKNESPRILIEVKKVWGNDSINKDAMRLNKVLGRGGSSREGLVVVYTHACKKETLERRFKSICAKSKTNVTARTGPVKFQPHWSDNSWYWEAACFRVKAQQ